MRGESRRVPRPLPGLRYSFSRPKHQRRRRTPRSH
jgi:hypothetical protein